MTIKAVNDIADFDDLVLTLFVFDAYSRMHVINFSFSSITQRVRVIEKAMTEIRRIRAENQIVDVLNTRNDSNVSSIHN